MFALTALFFFFFFLLPIWETLGGAFRQPGGGFTLDYMIEVFRNPIYLEGLWNSLQMAVYSTIRGSGDHHKMGGPSLNHGNMPCP